MPRAAWSRSRTARFATCRFPESLPPNGDETMMNPSRRGALAALAAFAAAGAAAPLAWAADPYPSRPIQLVMPFPPGGSFDPIFRTLAEAASKDLGQPIVLMHKPGAGGVTGTAGLATMNEADGYTISVMHNSVIRAPL